MRLLFAGLLAAAVAVPTAAQDKKASPATIKLLIPDKPTKTEVKIEGQDQPEPAGLKNGTRVFTTPDLEPGKTYAYKIVCVLVPNNYTRITRTREITFKAGETVEVDVRKEDPKNKDEIVVRWVPTPDDIVDKMCKLAKVGQGRHRPRLRLRRRRHAHPASQEVRGEERLRHRDRPEDHRREALPKIREEKVEDKVKVVQGDILKMTEKDCEEATVVLLYIGDDLGAKLSPILQKGLKPGSRVVSHRFKLGDWKPDKTSTVMGSDGDQYELHLWTIPEKKK